MTEGPAEPRRGPAQGAPETPEAKARVRALRLLARMEKSRRGLSLTLARAGFPRSVVGPVLDQLEQEGLVDDRRFTKLWLSTQARTRPRSHRLLRRDLLREGVEPQIVEEGLRDLARDYPEPVLAAAAARKKLRPAGANPARLAHLLAARGFAAAVVREALRAVLGDNEPGEGNAPVEGNLPGEGNLPDEGDAWPGDDPEPDIEP